MSSNNTTTESREAVSLYTLHPYCTTKPSTTAQPPHLRWWDYAPFYIHVFRSGPPIRIEPTPWNYWLF